MVIITIFSTAVCAQSNYVPYVYDPAYLLDDAQYMELNQLAAETSEKHGCAVHFVITDDPALNLYNIQQYSEDLYLYSPDFGYGDGKDGVMLVLGTYDRCYWLLAYGEKGNAQSHTILGCFLPNNHISVCEGISKGFKFLCDGIGIPCIVVTGTALDSSRSRGGHAWNLVSVNGKYRHLDVTGELTRAKRQGIAPRDGYLHTDSEMRENHYQWNATLVPAAY